MNNNRGMMSVVDRCFMACEQPPEQWSEEVLWPLPQDMRISIFGHSQIAMARNLTKTLVAALVDTGLCASNGQARTAIRNNAVMVNRKKCKDVNRVLTGQDALKNIDAITIENGKYNFGIIELCDATDECPNIEEQTRYLCELLNAKPFQKP